MEYLFLAAEEAELSQLQPWSHASVVPRPAPPRLHLAVHLVPVPLQGQEIPTHRHPATSRQPCAECGALQLSPGVVAVLLLPSAVDTVAFSFYTLALSSIFS